MLVLAGAAFLVLGWFRGEISGQTCVCNNWLLRKSRLTVPSSAGLGVGQSELRRC